MVKTMQQAKYEEQIEMLKKTSIVMHCTHYGCPTVVINFTTCVDHDPNTRGCQTDIKPETHEVECQTIPVIIREPASKTVPRILFPETKIMVKKRKPSQLKLCTVCFVAMQLCKNVECDQRVCKKCDKQCLFCKTIF